MKLTAEKCAWLIRQLKSAEVMSGELSIADNYKLQALEIALPVLEQQERQPSTNPQIDNDEWVEWGGGDIPPVEGLVEVRWSDGSKDVGNSHKFRWYRYKIISNIIAYRVIENDGREG